jgi:hypothetical protein
MPAPVHLNPQPHFITEIQTSDHMLTTKHRSGETNAPNLARLQYRRQPLALSRRHPFTASF